MDQKDKHLTDSILAPIRAVKGPPGTAITSLTHRNPCGIEYLREGINIIVISPELHRLFPDSESNSTSWRGKER